MKKIIITVVVVLALLFGVLAYRATSLFDDLQVEPAAGITEIQLDKAAPMPGIFIPFRPMSTAS